MRRFLIAPLLLVFYVSTAYGQAASQPQENTADFAMKMPEVPVDFYDGLRAWDAGQPEIALSLWLRGADLGDAKSMARVGDAYAEGKYLPAVPVLAAYYRALAARFGVGDTNQALRGLSDDDQAVVKEKVAAFATLRIPSEAPAKRQELTKDGFFEALLTGTPDEVNSYNNGKYFDFSADEKGWQAIHYAVLRGDLQIIDLFIRGYGFSETPEGLTGFDVAVVTGRMEVVHKFLDEGFPSMGETVAGTPASFFAERAGHSELAVFLKKREHDDTVLLQANLNRLGYDVGKPDGELNPRTRAQLAIFANGPGTSRSMSAYNLFIAMQKTVIDTWGVGITWAAGNKKSWAGVRRVSATSSGAAAADAISQCKQIAGSRNCKVALTFPSGACVALSSSYWSKMFPSEELAKADAVAICKAKGGRSCTVRLSQCA